MQKKTRQFFGIYFTRSILIRFFFWVCVFFSDHPDDEPDEMGKILLYSN